MTILTSLPEKLLSRDEKFEKLRNIFYRIRRICFVYLDSHHCFSPIQLNISKILINIFNYDSIFNPVEHDYDKILDASETVLTKEIYISPISSFTYKLNYDLCKTYLKKYSTGGKSIDFSNFLLSFLKGRREKFAIQFPNYDNFWTLQFYLAKDSLRIIDLPFSKGFESFIKKLYEEEQALSKIVNEGLPRNKGKFVVQHDMRGSLLYFTYIFPKNLSEARFKLMLRNISLSFHAILQSFQFPEGTLQPQIMEELTRSFRNDLIRRYFLYLLKVLFENENRLNLYVKFNYRQKQAAINSDKVFNRIFEANYSNNQKDLNERLDSILQHNFEAETKNTLRLIKCIAAEHSELPSDSSYYYTVLPIEIEEKKFDPSDLDRSGNAEARRVLTDIDAMLLIMKDEKIELYIIEGKDLSAGYQRACLEDLRNIVSMSMFKSIFEEPVAIANREYGVKGGYTLVKVQDLLLPKEKSIK